MDLRIQKTEKAIKNVFLELRARKPLEKITVKELCELALINKSTFYSHYEDIYALSEAMEQETVASIIGSIDHLKDYTTDNPDAFTRELCLSFMSQISLIKILFSGREFTRELCLAFMSQISLIKILFSGRELSHLGIRLDRALKEVIFRKYPEYENDLQKQILLSYSIQGTYYAYLSNPDADTDTFVQTIENIVRCYGHLCTNDRKYSQMLKTAAVGSIFVHSAILFSLASWNIIDRPSAGVSSSRHTVPKAVIRFNEPYPAVSATDSFCLSSQKLATIRFIFYNGGVIIDQTTK